MPKDDTKKRWRVREWFAPDTGRDEKQAYEDALNALDADGYDVYDVDFEKRWITGFIDDGEKVLEEAKGELGVPVSLRSFLSSIRERAAVTTPKVEEPIPVSEEIQVLHSYELQGTRSTQLIEGLSVVMAGVRAGDAHVEERLTSLIHGLFGGASLEETRKSLSDIEFFHQHHEKYRCTDTSCLYHQIYVGTEKKLKARLMSSPAN